MVSVANTWTIMCGKYLDQTCEPSTSLVMNTWTKHVSPDKSVKADGESGECQNLLSWSKPGRVRIMEALVLDPLKYKIYEYIFGRPSYTLSHEFNAFQTSAGVS
jgi:hypothetical protein